MFADDLLERDKISEIDQLFESYGGDDRPGASIAVIKKGQLAYSQGYGMANLEYHIPNTPGIIFHIASVSKQFTSFAILLLADEGKLSLDDDIRKQLPYVHDFGHTITLRHLMNHTSGLRDQWQLLQMAEIRMDDVIGMDHLRRFLARQRELNFEPGTKYMYCNSGYTLLAEVVLRVSGMSFKDFCHERIFKPLGMYQSHFHDNQRHGILFCKKEPGVIIVRSLKNLTASSSEMINWNSSCRGFQILNSSERLAMNFSRQGILFFIKSYTSRMQMESLQDFVLAVQVDAFRICCSRR